MDEKNKFIENYIINSANLINNQYENLIDNSEINYVIEKYKNSNKDLQNEIIPEIDDLVRRIVDKYKHLETFNQQQREEDELATLDLGTDKNGIFLSQQQIDLLMIIEIKSKEELKDYVDSCRQFVSKDIEKIVDNYNSISSPEQLEEAKRCLYKKYLENLITYQENFKMSTINKGIIKLEKLGIFDDKCKEILLNDKMGEHDKIQNIFSYIIKKYGNDIITDFKLLMRDDFENVKSVSYDEMESLSEFIQNDSSIDTIIIATGAFGNSHISYPDGVKFNSYFNDRALQYCFKHNKHMRYHTLFDQGYVEAKVGEQKGLKDHDGILSEMKWFAKATLEYIEKNNIIMQDGTMLINVVEIFNELVERNKENKNDTYQMVYEKHFGITLEELASCFDGLRKPNGVEFMYNETTLTESRKKRDKVEETLDCLVKLNPKLIDIFGDQMHLSDEDVMSIEGQQNLQETAEMIKRIQQKNIKTECTEHDFHFTKQFLKYIDNLKQKGKKNNIWQIKRNMQKLVSTIYTSRGVEFARTTYWSIFGKNDHNVVRANKKLINEGKEPRINTMSAGLINDGHIFKKNKLLNNIEQNPKEKTNLEVNAIFQQQEKSKFDKSSQSEVQVASQIREMNKSKILVRTKPINPTTTSSSGFVNIIILSLVVSFVAGATFMLIYFLINR